MKKIVNPKNGEKATYFETYTIGDGNACPYCKRIFKDYDLKALEERGTINCVKCGNKLKRQ